MADAAPVVHIGENSPEQVAFELLQKVALLERKSINKSNPEASGWTGADREWLLDTYAECLHATKCYRDHTRT